MGISLPKSQKRRPFPYHLRTETTATMKNLVRVIALVMACLFCAMVVVACETVKIKVPTTTREEGELWLDAEGKTWAADEWGQLRLYDRLPNELDYTNDEGLREEITVLYWSDVEKQEFEQDNESDNSRESAIYNRNFAVQSRLNIELKWKNNPGNSSNMDKFVSVVDNAYTTGQHDFDIIATYSRTAGSLLVAGLLYDLQDIQDQHTNGEQTQDMCGFIDLEQPWWPSGLVDDMRIGNSLYFLSGDIAITAIDEMHCIYFNKDLIDIQFEAEADEGGYNNATHMLYSYVREGKWTVDKLVEMASGYYSDNDLSGTKDTGDSFGLVSASYCSCTVYGGANLRQIEPDDAKVLKISDNYTSTRTVKLCKTYGSLLRSDDYYDRVMNSSVSYVEPFTNGGSLFCLQYIELAENNLVGNEAVPHYGLVPMPKYDEAQQNYYTVIGNAFTMYALFCDFDDRGNEEDSALMLSAIIECWASESYRKCTPVIFELNMQLKYSETQDETDMCEYVRAGICFDLGRVLDAIGFDGDARFFNAAYYGESWVAAYSATIDAERIALEKFVESLHLGE